MAEHAGRWFAAFASRRAPAFPSLEALAADARALPDDALTAARLVWRRRALNESISTTLATAMGAKLAATRLEPALEPAFDLGGALARLERDELDHATRALDVTRALDALALERPGAPTGPQLDRAVRDAELAVPEGAPLEALFRMALSGLAVCESVSAARFGAVLEHADLPAFRAIVAGMLADERAHAELGFRVVAALAPRVSGAAELARDELCRTFAALDLLVGLDAVRRGVELAPRAQPTPNPAVVEPLVDARAFYACVEREITPRLEALGLPAAEAWRARHAARGG